MSDRSEIHKDRVIDALSGRRSAIGKYRDFFLGDAGVGALLRYEAAMMLAASRQGAIGYALRKALYPGLFAEAGSGTNFGRNISLRCPGKMRIGANVAIDDGCAFDARGAVGSDGFVIGDRTLVARDTILLVKGGYLRIGADCSIGSQCFFGSVNGIETGDHCIIAGQCFLGGGRYMTARNGTPMVSQGLESKGPVVLGSDVWVGAGVKILDGARVGSGAILGAGAVITSDVPDYAIMAGVPARQVGER